MPKSIRVNISTETFEGLSTIAAAKGSTIETVASRLLNSIIELTTGEPASLPVAEGPTLQEYVEGRWGFSHGVSEADMSVDAQDRFSRAFPEWPDNVEPE